jgi:hypothetical protein
MSKRKLIVNNPNMRVVVAKAMVGPLRQRMFEKSFLRQIFPIEDLPQGALPVYKEKPL